MVLIFTDNEQLDRDLSKKIEDSRIVYYPDYVLEEKQATTLIATLQPNKYNFKLTLHENIDALLKELLQTDERVSIREARFRSRNLIFPRCNARNLKVISYK